MKFPVLLLLAATGLALSETPPVRIILVGDSTMAEKSGWGPGFCGETVTSQVTCLNMAKGGRSSSSYRQEGSWDQVMKVLKTPGDSAATYVLIQFGHNDQPGKPGRTTDLATEFPVNIRRYVDEVTAAGAKAVLVTPLTRRSFRDGKVKDSLGLWADATRKVAVEAHVPVLELNADSLAAMEKMGPVGANTLAMAPPPPEIAAAAASGNSLNAPNPDPNATERKGEAAPLFDYTHLGAKGSAYFAHMVARELTAAVPTLQPYLKP
jgi:lysophospholipase L1-like esterase